jgi:hypothetical protein
MFFTNIEELVEFYQPAFGKLPTKKVEGDLVIDYEKISRSILLKCAATMVEKKNLAAVRFKHVLFPRTTGIDANGRSFGTEVLVVNTSLPGVRIPAKLISAGKQDIGINGCVSLSLEGIEYYKKNLSYKAN